MDQITKANVGHLTVAWSYPTRDSNAYACNPIIIGNTMYLLARGSSLVALDATTGKEIWVHEHLPGIQYRGLNYWHSKDDKDRRLIFQINQHLQEIDARTGKSILTFGNNGLVDLRVGLGRDPEYHRAHSKQHSGKNLRESDHVRVLDGRGLYVSSRRSSRVRCPDR